MSAIEGDDRTEDRWLCSDLVDLVLFCGDGYIDFGMCIVEDISPSGASLHVDDAISKGSRVLLRTGGREIAGTVRHCVAYDNDFKIGVEFENWHWSDSAAWPRHTLEVR